MDDPSNAIRATINQVPETMEITRSILNVYLDLLARNQSVEASEQRLQSLEAFVSVLIAGVVELDSRVDVLRGGNGIPAGRIAAMLGEFGFSM